MPRDDTPLNKPLIGNQHFNAEAMLEKATRRGYPTAASNRLVRGSDTLTERAAEVAYWRGRCGLPVEADPAADEPAEAHDGHHDDDAAFLTLSRRDQQSLIRSYLVSEREADFERGAWLCRIAEFRLPAEAHAAWVDWHDRMASWQRRQRLAARGGRREVLVAGALQFEEAL